LKKLFLRMRSHSRLKKKTTNSPEKEVDVPLVLPKLNRLDG